MVVDSTRQVALEGSVLHNTTITEHVAYGSTITLRSHSTPQCSLYIQSFSPLNHYAFLSLNSISF
jgi:hypothetical protein